MGPVTGYQSHQRCKNTIVIKLFGVTVSMKNLSYPHYFGYACSNLKYTTDSQWVSFDIQKTKLKMCFHLSANA